MQMIGALFTSLVGGGTTSLATAGTWAAANAGGAITAGASIGSSALTLLQGAGTVFGVLSTLGSGAAAAAAGKAEQVEQNFESRNEFIQGKETSAALKAELARTVSNQAVAFAAGGVDLGSVSVGKARDMATEDAEKELSSASNSALTRSMQRVRAGRVAAARGRMAQVSSIFSAGNQIAQFGLDVAQRA